MSKFPIIKNFRRSRRKGGSVFILKDLFIIFIFVSLISFGKVFGRYNKTETPNVYLPPPEQVKLMTFGYHEAVASTLWIRFLQDIETCGKDTITRAEHEASLRLNADGETKSGSLEKGVQNETDKMDDALFRFNPDEKVCVQGWGFRILNAIVELSPLFRPAYSQGATALSVLANDHEGAKIIFDKGIRNFPNDWLILYRAAYLYLYEMRDFKVAAHLLHKASKYGAPSWVNSLASRLFTRLGQAQLGYTTLLEYYKSLTDEKRKQQVGERLKKLEATFRESQKPSN